MADPVNYIPLGGGSETDALEALEEKGAPAVEQTSSDDSDDDKPTKQPTKPSPKK
jgi:hypothetical protein